ALISAFLVIRAGYGAWVPPEGITLPVAITALNTLVLILSGFSLYLAGRKAQVGANRQSMGFMLGAVVLGAVFVTVQGYEWVQLVKLGLTMTGGVFGAT